MEQKKTVLIVEDEKNIVDIIRFSVRAITRSRPTTVRRALPWRARKSPTSFFST